MESSTIESICGEIISVMSPVSICMFLVVLLVYSLSPFPSNPLSSSAPFRTAANLVYLETPSDSAVKKFEIALLTALFFIFLIAIVTFLLVILYYYNFTNFLKIYMRFSAFFVLGILGGFIFLSIIQHFSIPVDSITCFVLLFNFTVVGVLSLFSDGLPIVLRQAYTVSLGIIMATWFSEMPEWTTWVFLVAFALYDLVAVLAPGGPLKLLVELASTRDEELPSLVYEARPVLRGSGNRGTVFVSVSHSNADVNLDEIGNSDSSVYTAVDVGNFQNVEVETQWLSSGSLNSAVVAESDRGWEASSWNTDIVVDEEMYPLVEMIDLGNDTESTTRDIREVTVTNKGIKLGLGDFIIYSVLVGRAAMYDFMTVYACYLAIISGLGCTLFLLWVYRRALPALPISITLGVTFYFLTRLLLEPFTVGIATNLLMF